MSSHIHGIQNSQNQGNSKVEWLVVRAGDKMEWRVVCWVSVLQDSKFLGICYTIM